MGQGEAIGEYRKTSNYMIRDQIIEAVGGSLAAAGDVELVDGRRFIVMPGLINAHMHTWQTALRSVASNWTFPEYSRWVHAGLATHFRPKDIHIATLVGALNQIDNGTTALVDWCHNNPTPAQHRRGHHSFAQLRHPSDVHARHTQAGPQTWRAALLGDAAPARGDRTAARGVGARRGHDLSRPRDIRAALRGPGRHASGLSARRGVRPHRLDAPRRRTAPEPRRVAASGGRRAPQPVREHCAWQRPQRRAIGPFRRPRRPLHDHAGIRADFRTWPSHPWSAARPRRLAFDRGGYRNRPFQRHADRRAHRAQSPALAG